jgi:hypothetical protein
MFMATASNQIKIQIGEEVKVLTPVEAVAFESMRDEINASAAQMKAELENKLNARKAVLAKLGLTDEDIDLILNLEPKSV